MKEDEVFKKGFVCRYFGRYCRATKTVMFAGSVAALVQRFFAQFGCRM